MRKNIKVAIVHDYLHEYGGAEAVVNAIWELYPDSDIYTATYNPEVMKKIGVFQGARIIFPKWKNSIFGLTGKFLHKVLIANLPMYFENLNLKKYDLVISSTAHFAKGVITKPSQLHVSYIHTPPRFLYGYPGETRKRDSKYWRLLLNPLDMILRVIDFNFAQRPDYILCNSNTVKKRIEKFYRRDATVIYPFPQVHVNFTEKARNGNYYLVVSRLASYKNIDLLIKTCGKNNIKLKIAGSGSSGDYLRELASNYKSVEMLGLVSESRKAELYEECRAVLCAVKDEDFGMAPLEPMMYGKPVVALRESGYLETVVEDKTGVFFNELTEKSLLDAIKRLESKTFDTEEIRRHAKKFSKDRFKRDFKKFVDDKLTLFDK